MNFDGKVANQPPRQKLDGTVLCAKCGKILTRPHTQYASLRTPLPYTGNFLVVHYLGKNEYIYETKLGYSVCYCSKHCRNKHNHRFQR